MRETDEQFTARMLICALRGREPADEDLARLTTMAQPGPSSEEQAAAELAGEEPGLAPPSVADYRRAATPDDADAQGGGDFG